jgi:hypothetical protein
MSSAVSSPTPNTRPSSLLDKINLRMIIFAGVVLVLVGFPVYIYLESAITGGVKDVGNGFKEVDLKAMSNFPFDQVRGTTDDIPKKWRDLDGQKVVLYGEMWQPFEAGDGTVKGFDLCYSVAKCCFSGPPQVQHFVKARVVPGRSVYSAPNLVKVVGKLHVNVVYDKEAGKVSQVYQLDVEDIQPAT